jgi:hypothetical protein
MKGATVLTSVLAFLAVLAGWVGMVNLINSSSDRSLREKAVMVCLENQRQAVSNMQGREAWRSYFPDCKL